MSHVQSMIDTLAEIAKDRDTETDLRILAARSVLEFEVVLRNQPTKTPSLRDQVWNYNPPPVSN